MNRIVRESYPVEKLPEDLRPESARVREVRVTVEEVEGSDKPLTVQEIFALRGPPFRTRAEIDAEVDSLRSEWGGRG